MNQADKIARMAQLFSDCLKVAEAKGHDYAGDSNALSNFKDFGWKGIIVRLSDKYHRLKNFCHQNELKVKDESVIDTFMDMINYAALGILMFEEERDGE